jgi:hypothetical protein
VTKLQVRFRFEQPLDDAALSRLSDTTALYGIHKIKMDPGMDGMLVEYDATRLSGADVAAAFSGFGIPVDFRK